MKTETAEWALLIAATGALLCAGVITFYPQILPIWHMGVIVFLTALALTLALTAAGLFLLGMKHGQA